MPISPDDIILNKAAVIERCIRRIKEEYASDQALENFTHLDALTLNIERACQAAIDLAMHIVAQQRLGMPQSSGDGFRLLAQAKLIPADMEQSRKRSRNPIFPNGVNSVMVSVKSIYKGDDIMTSVNSRKEALEEKRRFWKQHIKDWQGTDFSQVEYCRQHHLSVHRFTYWKRKFKSGPEQPFIELKLPAVPCLKLSVPTSPLRVAINRFQVFIDRDFDPVALR